jgi:hypothetical protein
MLDEGCGELGALDVHDALGRMGGHLETEVGADATVLTLTSLSRSAARVRSAGRHGACGRASSSGTSSACASCG